MSLQNNNHLDSKIKEFQIAIEKYHNHLIYNKLGLLIAAIVVSLQSLSVYYLYTIYNDTQVISFSHSFLAIIVAYILADFINGLTHMYMDNNVNYGSLFGPFIAAFHLHHKQPRYKEQHPVKIYYFESGAKLWLPVYLTLVIYLEYNVLLSFAVLLCLVAVGIFSSVAEVSHYWCHSSKRSNAIIHLLQRCGILLSMDHHKHHHMSDNINYAFLNGLTDPILNKIALYLYNGYKNNADLHVLAYRGLQTSNRE